VENQNSDPTESESPFGILQSEMEGEKKVSLFRLKIISQELKLEDF